MRLLPDIARPFGFQILPFAAPDARLPEISSKIRPFQSYYKLYEMQGLDSRRGRQWIDLNGFPGYNLSATDSVVYAVRV
jgi:hypothetical protein